MGVKDSRSDQQALTELTTLWVSAQPSITALIAAVVPDFHAGEDILQEVAKAVAESIDTYDRDRPFVPWALGITRKCISQHFRETGRSRIQFSEEVVSRFATEVVTLESELERRKEALRQCIIGLKGKSKEVIERRYLKSNSISDIADGMSMTITAVSVALHRARKSLADCVRRRLTVEKQK